MPIGARMLMRATRMIQTTPHPQRDIDMENQVRNI